jgi:hypothetical protein
MSAPVITRRVAVFTLFLFTAWMAVTAAANAMVPDPPDSGTNGPTHYAPATAASGGLDLTVWLLAAIAVAAVVAGAVGFATALHRRHLHPPTQAVN